MSFSCLTNHTAPPCETETSITPTYRHADGIIPRFAKLFAPFLTSTMTILALVFSLSFMFQAWTSWEHASELANFSVGKISSFERGTESGIGCWLCTSSDAFDMFEKVQFLRKSLLRGKLTRHIASILHYLSDSLSRYFGFLSLSQFGLIIGLLRDNEAEMPIHIIGHLGLGCDPELHGHRPPTAGRKRMARQSPDVSSTPGDPA